MQSRFDDMPDELLVMLIEKLDSRDSMQLAAAYPELQVIVNDTWRRRIEKHFPDSVPDYMMDYIDNWPEQFAQIQAEAYQNLPEKMHPLFFSIKEKQIREILQTELGIDELLKEDMRGNNLLSLAMRLGDQQLLDYFFKIAAKYFVEDHPFHPDLPDSKGNTIIHWAAFCRQDAESFDVLLECGCNINTYSDSGMTPLLIAVNNHDLVLANCVLEHHADPEYLDINNHSPMKIAIHANDGNLIRLLIRYGANFQALLRNGNQYAKPICIAAELGHLQAVMALNEHDDINSIDEYTGKTPLHIAAAAGKDRVVRFLIAAGANINARDDDEATPLHHAIINENSSTAKILIDNGCDIHARMHNRTNPLFASVLHGLTDVTEVLIARGAKPDDAEINHVGMSLLYTAAMQNNTDIIKLLICRGVDVNATSIDGRTALYVAVKNQYHQAAALLLSNLANPDMRSNRGYTPLYLAAKQGDAKMVKLLLDYHANAERTCTKQKLTPADAAAASGHIELAGYLRKHTRRMRKFITCAKGRLFSQEYPQVYRNTDDIDAPRYIHDLSLTTRKTSQ